VSCRGKSKGYQTQFGEIEVMHNRYGTLVHTLLTSFSIINALEGLNTLVFVAADCNPLMHVCA
jgi:hypothetical protein